MQNKFLRTKLIYIKNHPEVFTMLFTVIACVVFTCALGDNSNSLAALVSSIMPLAFFNFVATLFSILSIFTLITIKGKGIKPILMTIVYYVVQVAQIAYQFYFLYEIDAHLNSTTNPIAWRTSFGTSRTFAYVHIVLLIISVVLMALTPLTKKLFKKIKISAIDTNNGAK